MEKVEFTGIDLWEQAKNIEKSLPEIRREIHKKILELDPSIQYKDFGGLITALKNYKLSKKIAEIFNKDREIVESLKIKAILLRNESDRLIQEKLNNDTRKQLNPKNDLIPEGSHPKLSNCDIYPLRNSCNHGETQESKWGRCEYMKFDSTKGTFDRDRWNCTYGK